MDIILPIGYGLLLIIQIVRLVLTCRVPSKAAWDKLVWQILRELAIAVVLTILFNYLPGFGPMPGVTWLAETLYSMIAAVLYAVMLILVLLLRMIRK